MPGANAKALEKAKTLPADVLLLDLEDSVAPETKDSARAQLLDVLREGGYGRREIIVRINALSTPWGPADMAAFAEVKPHGLLVPKVSSGEEIVAIDAAMTKAGYSADTALWVMIETPRAILNIAGIAAAKNGTRLTSFVMGTNDLAKDTRARIAPGRAAFHAALGLAVTAARAEGIVAIDGVFNDIADAAGFEVECRQGLEFGFDGKTLIHPSQIDACNSVFAPTTDEITRARAVIDAFASPENAGKGVIKVDGKMTELLHLEEAKRVVAVAEAISVMDAA
jgi:citrate lyase subunit beta/citryl-CoA lyase